MKDVFLIAKKVLSNFDASDFRFFGLLLKQSLRRAVKQILRKRGMKRKHKEFLRSVRLGA